MRLATFADQTVALTVANMKARYRDTLTGLVWVILNPLVMYGAQAFAFSHVLRVDIANYNLYLLLGLLPWLFINQSVQMTATLLVQSGSFLKAYNIHPFVIVAATVLDNLFNFALAFLVVLIPALILSDRGSWEFLLLIGPAALLAIFTLILCWFVAITNVFFRDTSFIISFILNISFYLTPIFYSSKMISEDYRWLMNFNLFYLMIRPFQSLIDPGEPQFFQFMRVALSLTAAFAVVVAGVWRWRQNEFYNHL